MHSHIVHGVKFSYIREVPFGFYLIILRPTTEYLVRIDINLAEWE